MRRREGEELRKADSEIWTVSLYEFFFAGRDWLSYEKELGMSGIYFMRIGFFLT